MKGTLLSRFTPSLMKHEDLEAMLVQRHDLANQLVESIRQNILKQSDQHHLLIGMRGIGKTHLVSLMYHRVSKMEDLRDKVLIAWLREEEWGVTSFLDLLLRILRSLQQEYPVEYKVTLCDRVESLYNESPDTAQQTAAELLKDFTGDRTLFLLVENLDDLFEGLGDSGQQQFRDYLENTHFFTIFATSQHSFKGIDNKKAPFYDFFNRQDLETLTLAEVVCLLKNIAKLEGNKELELFIETPKGRSRIEAIHHLAGGNHRVYMIFAEFLTRDSLDQLVKSFFQTLDELTPYYQARMAWLSRQQRQIVEFLCDRRGAVMVKEIARRCFITHQTASSQLKQLSGMGYVTSESSGRESYYEIKEVLMRFCMDVKKHRGEQISLIVDFLRLWYTQEELKQRLERLGVIPFPKNYIAVARVDRKSSHSVQNVIVPFPKGNGIRLIPIEKQLVDNSSEKSHVKEQLNVETPAPNAVVEQEYLLRALQAREADDYENIHVAAYMEENEYFKENKDYVSALKIANKLLAIRGHARDWLEKANCLHKLKRYDEALESLNRAIDLDPKDWEAWMMQVSVFYKLDRYEEALASCDKAIELESARAIIWCDRGIVLNNLERYEEALTSYDKAIELDPNYAFIWNNRGDLLNNLGRYEEALASYDKAIELDPNYAFIWNNRGSVLDDLERYDEALASFDKAIELDPNDVWSWNNRGSVLNHLKRYDEALASLDKAIELDPHYVWSWSNRGSVLDDLKRYDEALASYDKAIELESDRAVIWYIRGYVLKNLERYEEALESCDKAIELEPNRASIWDLRGDVFDNLERYEEALASYDKAIELDPDNALVWNSRGDVLNNLERYEEALTSYDKAIELESDRASSWHLRGIALDNLERYEEALASYNKAIELEPNYASVWRLRGHILNYLERYEEALASYDKAIELEPNYASVWHLRGSVLNNLGRYEEALASYDKAIELEPNNLSAWNSRSILLNKLKRYDEALAFYDKAIELESDRASSWYLRGIVLNNLERYEEALASLDKAIELDPNYSYFWFNRGILLDNLERYEEALASLDKAIELDPNDVLIWDNRGDVLNNLGRYEEALASYDKAIELEPSYRVWVNRAFVLGMLDRYEEALTSCDKAIELEPNQASIWELQGVLLNNFERYEEALASFDKAIELDPNYTDAWLDRGCVLDHFERYSEALASYDTAIKLGCRDLSVFFKRAIFLLNLNRWDEGITALDDTFQRLKIDSEADEDNTILIISNLFTKNLATGQDRNTSLNKFKLIFFNLFANKNVALWKPCITSLIAVYEKHEYLSILGQGIVRNIPALMSEMVSDKAARTWLELWQELTSNDEQFQIPMRLLNAAVRYKETKGDRRVLLELPIEERNLLEPLVSGKVE